MPTFPPFVPPPLNAEAEPVGGPFEHYQVTFGVIGRANSFEDGFNGRVCTRTGYWVPRHLIKWFRGRPYYYKVCPTEPIYVPDPPAGIS